MKSETFRLVDQAHGMVIADRVRRVHGPIGRLTGLLGRSNLVPGEAIWLEPCNGIHTFGMRFAIDVLVLDRGMRVARMAHSLPPNRIVLPCAGGQSTVELAAGALHSAGVKLGDQLAIR